MRPTQCFPLQEIDTSQCLLFPIALPPPGVIPNFTHPQSRAWESYLTVTSCLSLMVTFVVLRFYSRKYIKRSLDTDDCFLRAGSTAVPTSDSSLRIRCFMGDGSCKTFMPLIGRYQVAALARDAIAIHSMWSAIICFTKALQYLILKSFDLDTEYTYGSLCLTGLDTRDSRRRNQSLFNNGTCC